MINDLYTYISLRNGNDGKFLAAVKKQYKKNSLFSTAIIRGLLKPLMHYLKPKKKVDYIFFSNKYSELILSLPKDNVCIVGGPKQIKYCLVNKIPLISNMQFWPVLYKGLETFEVSNAINRANNNFIKNISSLVNKDAVFIVDNDSMPMQRAVISAIKELGLKVCLIQDGLFQSQTPADIMHGWKSDIILCYDTHQQSVLRDKIKTDAKIDIVGFYKPIHFHKIPDANRKVCFLGQPWFKYGLEYQRKYIEILHLVYTSLDGYDVYFKPHPWECDAPYLKDLTNVYDGSMEEALSELDCFISLTSTALYEATLAGKLSIQILDDKFEGDDFQCFGYAYSINLNEIKEGDLINLINQRPIIEEEPLGNNLQRYVNYFHMKKYM